jgi:hypothetical protein
MAADLSNSDGFNLSWNKPPVHDMGGIVATAPGGGLMKSQKNVTEMPIANYDPDRKGIFIHKNQLADSSLKVGDRFSVKVGKQDLFSISIIKDVKGDIVYDKNGIFIERTRRIDILLGGIFDEYVLYIESDKPGSIQIRPLEAVIKDNYM